MIKLLSKNKDIDKRDISAVVSGKLIPLSEVNDEVFSKGMMGPGIATIPDGNVVVSPCDGEITMLFPTLHAFGIKSDYGLEILVHIGIDTVNAKGMGFKSYIKKGSSVHRGDKIIRIDSYNLEQRGYDLTTMILFPNLNQNFQFITSGYATRGKTVVAKYISEDIEND
jgi:glucose-specific phosphotransferase system IIA component